MGFNRLVAYVEQRRSGVGGKRVRRGAERRGGGGRGGRRGAVGGSHHAPLPRAARRAQAFEALLRAICGRRRASLHQVSGERAAAARRSGSQNPFSRYVLCL